MQSPWYNNLDVVQLRLSWWKLCMTHNVILKPNHQDLTAAVLVGYCHEISDISWSWLWQCMRPKSNDGSQLVKCLSTVIIYYLAWDNRFVKGLTFCSEPGFFVLIRSLAEVSQQGNTLSLRYLIKAFEYIEYTDHWKHVGIFRLNSYLLLNHLITTVWWLSVSPNGTGHRLTGIARCCGTFFKIRKKG